MKSFGKAVVALVILGSFYFLILNRKKEPNPPNKKMEPVFERSSTKKSASQATEQIALNTPDAEAQKPSTQKPQVDKSIKLTAGNFENFVVRCFQGEPCELAEDPWKLYQDFKQAGNGLATDHLISFLRKMLQDPKLKNRYKGPLKQMIGDFYPPEEKQFQEAAYYNYLGELQKSLDLYLDLEKKSASNPSLRPAPKLNIANTFYDLGRYKEALVYYQAALGEYASGQQASFPSSSDVIGFIRDRISEIESKLHS